MKYDVVLNSREWEIVAEDFESERFYAGGYDSRPRLSLTREAWKGDIPLYLHDVGVFFPDYLIEQARKVVTPEPVFAVLDVTNLTFAQMIHEIWNRRAEIVRVTPGDDNPY